MSKDTEYKGNKHIPYDAQATEELAVSTPNEPLYTIETDEFKADKDVKGEKDTEGEIKLNPEIEKKIK